MGKKIVLVIEVAARMDSSGLFFSIYGFHVVSVSLFPKQDVYLVCTKEMRKEVHPDGHIDCLPARVLFIKPEAIYFYLKQILKIGSDQWL